MGRTKSLAGLALLLTITGCSSGGKPAIVVGSKNFTEQIVLGEIIAQHLEHRLHQPIERRLNLGGTLLAQQALSSGQIDLYPEYTGTALAAVLKDEIQSKTPEDVLAHVRAAYLQKYQIEWLDPLGIDNGFAMVINGPLARAKHFENLSDAAKQTEGWLLGVGYEFEQRADGLGALDKTYHLKWNKPPQSMDLGLLYKALEQNQVSMIAANATDGLLSKMDLKVLTDDQHAFPPYQVCVATRQASMNQAPGLRDALQELAGKFTNKKMQELNFEVDGRHRSVSEVAADFLKQAGL